MTCLNVFGPLLPDPLEPTMFSSTAGCSLRWMIHFQAKMHHAEMQQQHFLLSSNWISPCQSIENIINCFFFQFFNVFAYGWSERIWVDVFHVDRPHWRRYCCYWLPNCSPSHPPFWCFTCWQYSEFPNVFQVFYHLKERTHTLAGHEYDVLRPFSVEFTTSFTHVKSRESHNIDVVHKNGTSNVNYRFGLVLNLKPRQDFVCCPPMWSCPSVMASCRWSSMDWEVCCFCWIWPPVVGFGWTDMIVGCEWYDVDNVENVGKI